jgi:hypothetical protein
MGFMAPGVQHSTTRRHAMQVSRDGIAGHAGPFGSMAESTNLADARKAESHQLRANRQDPMAQVLGLAFLIEGDRQANWRWYREDAIEALGAMTAHALVCSGRAHEVLAFLSRIVQDEQAGRTATTTGMPGGDALHGSLRHGMEAMHDLR